MIRFSEIVAEIMQKKQTGLLSVVPANGPHHLKLFFSAGEIYYLLYGDVKNTDCVTACRKLEFSNCFFTNGVKVSANEKCTLPTPGIIDELRKYFDKTPAAAPVVTGSTDGREKLKVALVRQVGPIGEIVFSTVQDQWQVASSSPTKQELQKLADLLGQRIEDEQSRKDFFQEAKSIIS